jgi:hypothetical protein
VKIASAAGPHEEDITTGTGPIAVPLNAQAIIAEQAAGIELGYGRRASQTNRVVRWLSSGLSRRQRFVTVVAVLAVTAALAAPAHADVDTDFANQLHVYGVYGPKDYNAWLGKIACKRLGNGTDADAHESAAFLAKNLPAHSTTEQTWQFLDTAINTYCPDQMPVLTSAAGPRQ